MKVSDFDFELPEDLVAQRPPEVRSASRLLVVDPDSDVYRATVFSELPRFLEAGDVLVLNDTRVIPARLLGRKATGGRIELLVEEAMSSHRARARARSSKPLREGGEVELAAGGRARCVARAGDRLELEFSRPVREVLETVGRVPLPPYIRRRDDALDRERYQTVFSRVEGAIAAPTAALHFDRPLLATVEATGVELAFVTLHVGAGTFEPVRSEDPSAHRMHAERVEVTAGCAARICAAREAGRRVVAVGTTVVRALESAVTDEGRIAAFSGHTDLYIRPGFRFRAVDALITNFHLPRSTLMMLVCAFAGRERILDAYRYAVAHRFRFFSYGDAMLVTSSGSGQ